MNCIEVNNYLQKFNCILSIMSNEMLSECPKDSITLYFIKCMIPHHQAAICMCENLLSFICYKPLQDIACNIINIQTIGIDKMREIITTKCLENAEYDMKRYYNRYREITCSMIHKMRVAQRCSSINLNFVNEMIPHHEGAVKMSENLLRYSIDCRLKEVAENIIKEQSEGIKELSNIRRNLC